MNDATDPVGGGRLPAAGAEAAEDAARLIEGDDPPPRLPPEAPGPAPQPYDPLVALSRAIDWEDEHRRNPGLFDVLKHVVDRLREAGAVTPEMEAQVQAEPEAAATPPDTKAETSPPPPATPPHPEVIRFGASLGFTPQEMAAVADPRELRVLNLAMIGERALAAEAQARRFAGFRPPTQVGGHGHPGPLSDRTNTEAWMQARQSQLRKKAR